MYEKVLNVLYNNCNELYKQLQDLQNNKINNHDDVIELSDIKGQLTAYSKIIEILKEKE